MDRSGDLLAGRYRVRELLGVGGMGSVWIAEHLALKHEVVVKFHEEGFRAAKGDRAYQRFLREARMLGSAPHRNVAELYEAGSNERGVPYLIMQRLHGETLAARLRRQRRLPLLDALRIARAVASGLEAVHAAGVLHRDIKPENLFLHEDEESGEIVPKLIDFGVARPSTKSGRVTLTGEVVGTPGYMAPELARGKTDVDGRVDVYALCATLYELLTGELPVAGESAMDRMIATVRQPPMPIRHYRGDLPGEVEQLIMAGLARDPKQRVRDARRLREWLDASIEALVPSDTDEE
ncbi:MAG: serine/threonine-protein kinase [Sandaracinaceae bacterium]